MLLYKAGQVAFTEWTARRLERRGQLRSAKRVRLVSIVAPVVLAISNGLQFALTDAPAPTGKAIGR
jgi:hypothetical protein